MGRLTTGHRPDKMCPMSKPSTTLAKDHPAVLKSLEAMSFGRKSWEAGRDECIAWAAVRDLLPDTTSNLGQRYIWWRKPLKGKNGGTYQLRFMGPLGMVSSTLAGPPSFDEAECDPRLVKVIRRRDETLAAFAVDHPNWKPSTISHALTRGLRSVLDTTPEGRAYIEGCARWNENLKRKILTADSYAPNQWCANSCIEAHAVLRTHSDRFILLKQGISVAEAKDMRHRNTPTFASKNRPAPIEPPPALRLQMREAYRLGCRLADITRAWKLIEKTERELATPLTLVDAA